MHLILGVPALLLAGLAIYVFWPRCNLYQYVVIRGFRVPVLIGRIRKDGTLLDLTKPWRVRLVGQFSIRDHDAYLRLYNLALGDEQAREVGKVEPKDLAPVRRLPAPESHHAGDVERQGRRTWWDLFLRLHAPVLPSAVPPPFKVVEFGRFRHATDNVMTLLAQGGAAILLYGDGWGTPDTLPYRDPTAKWDTALPAAFLFGLLFLPAQMRLWFWDHPFAALDGWSGTVPLNGLAPGLSVFLAIWAVLYLLKRMLLSSDDRVLDYVILFNRSTGLRYWAPVGIFASIGLAVLTLWHPAYWPFVPLYAAMAIGFFAVSIFAPRTPWEVQPREFVPPELPPGTPEDEGDGEGERKHYSWQMDSGFRTCQLEVTVPYQRDEIRDIRTHNPFFSDPAAAVDQYGTSFQKIVAEGWRSRQVSRTVAALSRAAREGKFSAIETIQAVLGLVQEPAIAYALDEDCDEIQKRKEYCRLAAETLYDGRGDCDCKSALAATLFKALGFPVLGLLNDTARHAAVAVGGVPEDMPGEGKLWFEHQGERYYYCETTGRGWQVGQASPEANAMVADPRSIVDLR